MALSPGTRLGPYEILSALGTGGMGEVYRARDTKLNREVAIKVLLPAVATDADRMARFSREAQLLASLNHSNIGSIYGLEDSGGAQAIVMELVEGPTLADRLAGGPLAPPEAVAVAMQIADALEVAHERGIIHRDLKPANIKVKTDGTVKVLDFGLAKALDSGTSSNPGAMNSPTLTAHATAAGIILGTAAYMAPEQARGKATDRRSDVWAFGCILFEMLTGRMAFGGETTSDTIAAVLGREPDWSSLPPGAPASLRRLLRRCLEKDPKRRLRDLGDARLDLEEATTVTAPDQAAPRGSRRRERLAWISALTLVTLAAVAFAAKAFRAPAGGAEMRVDIATPPTRDRVSVAISPDGSKIAFVADASGASQLWVRRLDSGAQDPQPGTSAASLPFWSADSRSIGFFADGKLKRLDIDSGAVTVLTNAPNGQGGAWSADGTILFAPVPASPLLRIAAGGGELATVTTVAAPKQVGHGFPHFLPDGRHFIFQVQGAPEVRGTYVGELGNTQTSRILDSEVPAVYASSGHLLFVGRGRLLAQSFDASRFSVSGDPFEIATGLAVHQQAALSASASGPIVYRHGASGQRLQWFDASGKELGLVGNRDIDVLTGPSSSRDGRRFALFWRDSGNVDVWLLDPERGGMTKFTDNPADDIFPVWSPDGVRIVFSSTRGGQSLDLYVKAVDGTGNEDLLFSNPQIKAASDWSPDGRFVLYSGADRQSDFDIWALPVDGERKPFAVVQSKSSDRLAQFSPDGQWIAYESNESSRYEIYLQPFTGNASPGGKVPITTDGGAQARWRRDGKALFYIAIDGRLMEVPLRFGVDGRSVEPGVPIPRFDSRTPGGALQAFPRHQYASYPDGRFAVVVEAKRSGDVPAHPPAQLDGQAELSSTRFRIPASPSP